MHVQGVSVLLGIFMLIFLCMCFHILTALSSSSLPTPPSFDWWLPRGIAKYVTHAAVRKMFGATESQYQLMEVRALHIVTYVRIVKSITSACCMCTYVQYLYGQFVNP